MTAIANFKELVNHAMDTRKSIQLRNFEVREQIATAVQAAHEEQMPWKAAGPDEELVGNVTKRLNVWCEDVFRLHLVVYDGGRVLFPKSESGEMFSANDSAEALLEVARRFALHRLPDEAVVVRRTMSTR